MKDIRREKMFNGSTKDRTIELLKFRFNVVSKKTKQSIQVIEDTRIVDTLFQQAGQVESLDEFEEYLERVQELIEYSVEVDARVQVLDKIEEKLLKMRVFAERVASEDLPEQEIQKINEQVQELVKEVERLDSES